MATALTDQEFTELVPLSWAAKRYLVIAGYSDYLRQQLVLFRSDGKCITVSFDELKPSGTSSPDFDKLSIVDYGHTVKLGEYEVNTYSII